MEKNKIFQRLKRNVGKQCEITCLDGRVIYGKLDGFDYDKKIMSVECEEGLILFNWNGLLQIRFSR